MPFVFGAASRLEIDGTEISDQVDIINFYLDPETGWNLVVEGFYSVDNTLVWARKLKGPKPYRSRSNLTKGEMMAYSWPVKFAWRPSTKTDEGMEDGRGDLKNFKVDVGVDDAVRFKLHLVNLVWTKERKITKAAPVEAYDQEPQDHTENMTSLRK